MVFEQTAGEQRPRVLIVDDDQDTLALLTAWPDGSGFQSIPASSGPAALAQLSMVQPQLVMTDLVMEGMDGMTLMAEIHRQNPLKPVIMFSGRAGIPDAVKATHLGSLAVLTKPVNKEELIEQVKKALHLSHSGERPETVLNRHIVYRSTVMAELLDQGLFQGADGGTLFLDEIGDMPLSLQVKLLRVLQDFEVRPVGAVRGRPVNVRIISATHNGLEQAVKAGEFREDLYYRLHVVQLTMPSLAERREEYSYC